MAIENRNLEVGTRLVANYKKQSFVCTVVKAEDDQGVVFNLEDGKSFNSLSSAGSWVMGGKAVNGWKFWSLEDSKASKPAARSGKPAKARKTRAKGLMSRIPSRAGLEVGKSSWFCNACMKPFVIDGDEPPEVCPKGIVPTTRN